MHEFLRAGGFCDFNGGWTCVLYKYRNDFRSNELEKENGL